MPGPWIVPVLFGAGAPPPPGVPPPGVPDAPLLTRVTPRLERSTDPLSVVSPTYEDITSDLRTITWGAGVDNELDSPRAGFMNCRLKNTLRRHEPDHNPDLDTEQRYRLTLIGDDGSVTQEGVWFSSDYALEYPAGTDYSEVVVTCTDGQGLNAIDELPRMDPPDASSYEEVVNFDEPSFYYRLGEQAGTKMVSHLRSKRWRKKHPHGKKRFRTIETREELGGISGPAGTYKGTPTLAVDGLIIGDGNEAVRFNGTNEYARVPLEEDDLIDSNKLTVECWFNTETFGPLVAGPVSGTISDNVWLLQANSAPSFNLEFTSGASLFVSAPGGTVSAGNTYHLAGTWDGHTARIYVNGELLDEGTAGGTLRPGSADDFLYIAKSVGGFYGGVIDEVAVYERALSPERILAHYQAGAERGLGEQGTGERIRALADNPLWSVAAVDDGKFRVQPIFFFGQSPQEEIDETAVCERPFSLYFYDGQGNPQWRGWDWQANAPYNTPQAVIGDVPGQVPYRDISLVFDNQRWNDITGSKEGGDQQNVTDESTMPPRRSRTEEAGLLVTENSDVREIIGAILARFNRATLRPESVSLIGSSTQALTQMLTREIGDRLKVVRLGEDGAPIERITHIIGKTKSLDVSTGVLLTCEWNLARGFDATSNYWHAGTGGYSELGTTTVLA